MTSAALHAVWEYRPLYRGCERSPWAWRVFLTGARGSRQVERRLPPGATEAECAAAEQRVYEAAIAAEEGEI